MTQRNVNYDLFRLIGLLVIIMAHASPPDWLFQLRNFGTPMLVLGSGLTYAMIYANRTIQAKQFLLKRVPKLLIPTWIFLSLFFLGYLSYAKVTQTPFPFSFDQILESFMLSNGIGFVWVFKIYIILAFITPLAVFLNKRIQSNNLYFTALFFGYIFYELFASAPSFISDKIGVLLMLAPYVFLYFYAFRLPQLSAKQIKLVVLVSLSIAVIIGLFLFKTTGHFVQTQEFKYPPTIYYVSYSFFAINLLYLWIINIQTFSFVAVKCIAWLSANSLWIYLWHIFAFYLWNELGPSPNGHLGLFIAKTGFLILVPSILVGLQNNLIPLIPLKWKLWSKYLVPILSNQSQAKS